MVTISNDPTIVVFSIEDLEAPVADTNVDVEVHVDGARWAATFFTLENLEALMRKNAVTGECASGLYLWATDMIVVRELSYDVIRDTVAELRRAGEFEDAFSRLEN
jgi:hypothetical protein